MRNCRTSLSESGGIAEWSCAAGCGADEEHDVSWLRPLDVEFADQLAFADSILFSYKFKSYLQLFTFYIIPHIKILS